MSLTGADPGFFLGGGALVSCSTSTPIHHIVFFCRIPVVLKNRRLSGGGGGSTPCTLPLDPPLSKIKRIVYSGHNEVGVGGKVVERKDSTVLNLVESVSDFEYFSLNLGL